MATDVERVERITAQDLDLIRAMYAPKATDVELKLLAEISRQHGLSIFRGELAFIPSRTKEGERWLTVHKPYITNQGRRVIAARTGELRGIEGPWWTRPYQGPPDQRPWDDVWEGPGFPRAARVIVHRVDHTPYRGTAMWDEAVQTYSDGRVLPTWEKQPALMLGKVAESRALGRAFPELFVGMAYAEDDASVPSEVAVEPPEPPAPSDAVATAQSEYVPPTAQQLDEVKRLLGLLDLSDRRHVLALASMAAGREVKSTRQMWRHEVAALLGLLTEAVERQRAAEDVEPDQLEPDEDVEP